MNRVTVTLSLTLPQDLVDKTQSAGLLSEAPIQQWLLDELDRKAKLDRFFDKLDRLTALTPSLREAEIVAELEAYRQEKRQQRKNF